MPVLRLRLAVALVSAVTVGLELALMRALSLRFWSHFAYMVIGVALLGFGASGTMLTLLRRRVAPRPRTWLWLTMLLFAVSVLVVPYAMQAVPLNVHFLAWSWAQALNVLEIELLFLVPFLLAGTAVGIALMDRPDRIAGHYAANLIGSGAGAVAAVLAMHVLSTAGLFVALAIAAYLAAAVMVPWRRLVGIAAAAAAAAGGTLLCCLAPWTPAVSQYKDLSRYLSMPGSEVIHRAEGPLGRIDVVAGPSVHSAPGLSLQYAADHPEGVPPQVLLLTDGDEASSVYHCRTREDWAFMRYTTPAPVYRLYARPRVLIIGAGGGSSIGLARYHRAAEVVALEMNPQIAATMTGPLFDRGGDIYRAPGVRVAIEDPRGYLAGADRTFDIIQVPAVGAAGAGLYDTQESYLYTVESFVDMLDHLSPAGALCITRRAEMPPRDELRAFDMAAAALRRRGLDPARHLAMIRNLATVSVIAFKTSPAAGPIAALRTECGARGLNLCYLPGLARSEANAPHELPSPYYFDAAHELLGPGRDAFIGNYLFDLRPATDDRPYFYHTFRWRALPVLREQLRGMSRAFLPLGYVMSFAALAQGTLAAVVLILLPLLLRVRALVRARRRGAVFGYFLMLGLGFMLLEMGFLQKLTLYLAHPIYSAAAVIAGFLVFSGLGSQVSGRWQTTPKRVAAAAAAAIACVSAAYLLVLDGWLGLTQAQPISVRFLIAAATIAPLAFAMGHMFPAGLRQVGTNQPTLVPWAWAVNGFASVVAAAGMPLLAAEVGFSRVVLAAVVCYAFAGVLSRWLPER